MRRALVVAVALAGCRDAPAPPPAPVVYPAAAPRWPAPPVTARLGDGAPRLVVASAPIVAAQGGPTTPLAMVTLVGAADGPPEAALAGRDAEGPALELIDVDRGVVRWRNRTAALPAVAVLGARVFAAAGEHVVALDRATGAERARFDARWLHGVAAADGARAVVATAAGSRSSRTTGSARRRRCRPAAPRPTSPRCARSTAASRWRGATASSSGGNSTARR